MAGYISLQGMDDRGKGIINGYQDIQPGSNVRKMRLVRKECAVLDFRDELVPGLQDPVLP